MVNSIVVIFGIFLAFISQTQTLKFFKGSQLAIGTNSPHSLSNIRYKFVHDREVYTLSAKKVFAKEGVQNWALEGIQILKSDNLANFSSKLGELNVTQQELLMYEDVKFSYEDYDFYTDSLLYANKNKKIKSLTPVQLKNRSKEIEVRANVFEFDISSKKLFLYEDVKGLLPVASKDQIFIAYLYAETFELNTVKKLFTLSPRVKLHYKETKVESNTLKAKMKKSKVNSIELFENVRVTSQNAEATSEYLKFNPYNQSLLLKKNPVVIRSGYTLKGEEIIYFPEKDQIQVLKGELSGTFNSEKPINIEE